eukprot:scaffold2242_cov370-Prasinococcus_capsulatus_cf.AAC.2
MASGSHEQGCADRCMPRRASRSSPAAVSTLDGLTRGTAVGRKRWLSQKDLLRDRQAVSPLR